MCNLVPGKKYVKTHTGQLNLLIGFDLCLKRVWQRIDEDIEAGMIWVENNISDWKEFKEPVLHTRYVHWYKNIDGKVWASMTDQAEPSKDARNFNSFLHTAKLTYVER